MPTEESLLNPEEVEACEERGIQGYFFARAVLGSDFQISNSHPLPRAFAKLADDGDRDFGLYNNLPETNLFRIPAPRFLGFLQLSLFEILGNEKFQDLAEAFHWSCPRNDTTLDLTATCDRYPVYPLFQPSADDLNDYWIAVQICSSALPTSKGEMMQDWKIPRVGASGERGALIWFSSAHDNSNLAALYETEAPVVSPTKMESFPAYLHLERANRLVCHAT
ncbi:unnamed protein product [Hydatigera taeniaeformis]|uniref:Uncharacterized protein n=1 Tax=Hydatigena taeniaeformis TaxID=6205 RepID=A0A3P7F336_HYDTA|nr:unnamed protein product [Hydatigera taeniaeformis]